MSIAFVTGATGLLGANLVHILIEQGWTVRALVRSLDKAKIQLGDLDVEIIQGDMEAVAGFADHLVGVDVLFHTAAYFRDSYKGGSHWDKLHRINVVGTEELLEAAWDKGVRKAVHISSSATVLPPQGRAGNEDDRRDTRDAKDDYFRSKVMSDLAVEAFMERRPEFFINFVLPGFMQGPRDLGPTSAGQMLLDFVHKRLPGVLDVEMSFVDVRDVASGVVLAAQKGQRGRRYLVAGRTLHMGAAFTLMEEVTGVSAPKMKMPRLLLYAYAGLSEVWARLSGRPVLLSWSGVNNIIDEGTRSNFDSSRAQKELGVVFRPLEDSFRDSVAWYQGQGFVS